MTPKAFSEFVAIMRTLKPNKETPQWTAVEHMYDLYLETYPDNVLGPLLWILGKRTWRPLPGEVVDIIEQIIHGPMMTVHEALLEVADKELAWYTGHKRVWVFIRGRKKPTPLTTEQRAKFPMSLIKLLETTDDHIETEDRWEEALTSLSFQDEPVWSSPRIAEVIKAFGGWEAWVTDDGPRRNRRNHFMQLWASMECSVAKADIHLMHLEYTSQARALLTVPDGDDPAAIFQLDYTP